ncbi:MAG: rod shape-determining protein MreD [Candidatus Eremiobacteraeota bacterium]|nr:rod shape-determining protein MreD [Candidatus Eremiobacteraeota bacterium]
MIGLLSSQSKLIQGAPFAGPPWQRAAALLALALLAQITVLHYFTFRNAECSPVLVVVVWYAIASDFRRATIFGVCAGFLEDALSGGTGGAWTASTAVTAFFTAMLSRSFFSDSIPLLAAILVVATLLRNAIFWWMMEIQGYPTGVGYVHFHQTLWQAGYNALFMIASVLLSRYYAKGARE